MLKNKMLAHNKLGEIEILKPTIELGVYLALLTPSPGNVECTIFG